MMEKTSTESSENSVNTHVASQDSLIATDEEKIETNSNKTCNSEATVNNEDNVGNLSTNNQEKQNSSEDNCNINKNKQTIANDSFKGENLQQLSTNALPPYTPGSPPAFMKLDIQTFDIHCCTDCGDTFAFKSSLNFHLERRSVLIKFPCDTCKTTRIFYNRCNLLSHIRNHSDKNETSDMAKAIITVLPRVFMDGIQNDFVSALDDELNSIEDSDVLPPSELLECSLQESDEPLPSNETESAKIAKVKCLDCNEEFDTARQREEHLTNGDKMPVVESYCNKCGMICPSKCSLKAHQRIHLQISPYVCPECGESPDPHWANFLHHVNLRCFHNTRSVGFKCPVCKNVLPNKESLVKHMELHTEKYAKCSECPRAYNSSPAFKSHNNMYHDGEEVRYTVIYKCSLCDIVFVNRDLMLSHRSAHIKDKMREYVFDCMQCGKPFESKVKLVEHIKTAHPQVYKESIESKPLPSKSPVFSTVSYKGMVECLLCGSTFHSHQGYIQHVNRAHVNHHKNCELCNNRISNRKEMIKHGKTHLEDKIMVCLLCNNKKMASARDLDNHLDYHTAKLRFCSCCPICERLFHNLPYALNHLREEHLLPQKPTNTSHYHSLASVFQSDLPVQDLVCRFCRSSFATDEDLQIHMRHKHNIESQNSDKFSSGSEERPLKKQRIEGNSCAKCDYHSASREDFKKHILSHKTNRSTVQCQECGLCFVVMPSLTKHLRVVHKISDPKKYVSEEGTNFVPDLESTAEVSKRSALECEVCFTSFPNETSLKTHMRSHGMAFIQANKSSLS